MYWSLDDNVVIPTGASLLLVHLSLPFYCVCIYVPFQFLQKGHCPLIFFHLYLSKQRRYTRVYYTRVIQSTPSIFPYLSKQFARYKRVGVLALFLSLSLCVFCVLKSAGLCHSFHFILVRNSSHLVYLVS